MEILITVMLMAISIVISLRYLKSSRAVWIDRQAPFNDHSSHIECPYCSNRVKRQSHGQQCSRCRKSI